MHFPKTYLTNLTLKCYPEKRPRLTLNPKHTPSKLIPRIFASKSYPDKRTRPNLTSKQSLSKRTSLTLS